MMKVEMRRLVAELRAMSEMYLKASGDAKWDHRASFQHGTAQGLLHAAGRLEERLGWPGAAEQQAEDALGFDRKRAYNG